ncbi:MAG: hypothetical protein LBE98_01465, partial [Puniceicoccales bacterium]|nr:hypothetical protein [Puniceicoccales bacterium]
FFTDLEQGKFDPGSLRKFILWLCSKFGGPEYEAAVKQFTAEAAAAEHKDVFSQEDFLNDLAAAVKGYHSKDLPEALRVIYDLLSADPEARRDFFINRLFIPCLEEAHTKASGITGENDIKSFISQNKKYLAINQFRLKNKMKCEGEATNRVWQQNKEITDKIYTLAMEAMYHVIASPKEERDQHLQYLEDLRNIQNTAGNKCVDVFDSPYFEEFDRMNGDFSSILECFGNDHNEQIGNFKALVEGLKKISREVLTEEATHRESGETYDREKNWKQKAGKFFEENQKLMWAALRMLKTNQTFVQGTFREFIRCPMRAFEGASESCHLAARQTMKNAVNPDSEPLTNEQVRLLCGGVNLSALLHERNIEKNKDTIDMVLRFIQGKALECTDPQISFKDIMPEDISDATCRRLVKFVEEGNYDQRLVDFIQNGVAQRQAH